MSPKNHNSSYDLIRCCLEQELKDKEQRLEFLSEPVQLLIMESQKDVAAFTVMNGSPRQLYETAYEQFKKLYNERNKDWANKYLSFVLCRTDESTQEDSFYSELENDVYFCKKYVIYLKRDYTDLHQEMQRLPFIPLRPESIDALKRPVSAQTLLQKCGLDTELARHLVKAKEKAADTIARNYLAKRYDRNPFKKPEDVFQTTDDSVTSRISTRLQSLVIENFRAYKHQEFDLSGDIIILYGPNGLGKTSFYDALDFACTGRIARLTGKIGKVAPHLDSEPSKSCVTIQVEKNSKTEVIKRTVDSYSYANINEEKVSRKELLSRLTGLVWEDTAARVENLEKLFRATHLFGQDYQELLTDYRDNSELSEEIVARMLAFEDYVLASKKAEGSVNALKNREENISFQCRELKSKLKADQNQRAELEKTVKVTSTPGAIKKLAQEIADRLKHTLNIDLPIISQIDKDEIRSWRATISGEIEVIQEQLETSTILERKFGQIVKSKENWAKNKKELQQSKDEIEVAKKKIAGIQKERKTLLKTFHELTSEKDKLSEKQALNTWHLQAIEKHRRLSKRRSELLLKHEELSLSPDVNLERLKADEDELLWVKDNLSQWKESCEQIKSMRVKLNKVKEKRKEKEKQLNNSKTLYKKKKEKLLKPENKISSIRKDESELLTIIDNIERFVNNSVCPVCGTDHHTKKRLLQRIKEQKTKRSPQNEAAIKGFQQEQKEVNELKDKLASLKREISAIQEHEKSIYDDLHQLEEVSREFQERAKLLGLKINRTLAKTIDSRLEQMRALKKYAILDHDLENITLEAKTKKLPLTIDVKELQKTLSKTKQQLLELQESIRKQELQKKAIEKQLDLENDNLKAFKEKQATINVDIDNLARKISEYERDLAKLDLNADASIELIQSKKAKLQKQTKKAIVIKDEIIRLETAIDSAQSSARLAELDSEIAKTKDKLSEQQAEIEEIAKALNYFEKIGTVLTTRKNTAVREYTNNLGPLASIIQRRLRAVYGFGPVNLKSKAGKIYVRVSRRSQKPEDLRPIDYFSDSQNQILMLSLFLAAGRTQSWSSFAPILMDDPITHFDDLNAYAFVELIRGLVDDAKGNRQFIISTCDESLWDLFRQRFSSLDGQAIMYKFIAIGDEGPIVK